MKTYFRNSWQILKQTLGDFLSYNVTGMSAALAYYTIFSIAPILILVIRVSDVFFSKEAIEGKISGEIRSFVGDNAAVQIQELIKNASLSPHSTLAAVIGVVSLLLAATGVFTEIQSSINFIWRLRAKPKKGWLKMIVNRVMSFSMIVGVSFILIVSLLVNSVLDAFSDRLSAVFHAGALHLAYGINLALTFGIISLLFGIIFKVLPDARIEWRDVRVGAFTTAILFMLGKFAIGYYLGQSKISSTYGAAGSIVVILLWVYYSAIILYFGAAFTKVYARFRGRDIFPSDYAVWIQQVDMESRSSLTKLPVVQK